MNVYRLADRLGKSAGEVMALPAEELTHWIAYSRIVEAEREAARPARKR